MGNRFYSQASADMKPFSLAGVFTTVSHLVSQLMRQLIKKPAE